MPGSTTRQNTREENHLLPVGGLTNLFDTWYIVQLDHLPPGCRVFKEWQEPSWRLETTQLRITVHQHFGMSWNIFEIHRERNAKKKAPNTFFKPIKIVSLAKVGSVSSIFLCKCMSFLMKLYVCLPLFQPPKDPQKTNRSKPMKHLRSTTATTQGPNLSSSNFLPMSPGKTPPGIKVLHRFED